MKQAIKLIHNKGFKWEKYNSVYIKGIISDKEKLINSLNNSLSVKQITQILAEQKGNFALIAEKENLLIAATGPIRSIPLFYSFNDDHILISDDAKYLKQHTGNNKMNRDSETEYLLTGYVTGNNTLISEIRQLQAGQLLIIRDNKIELKDYFSLSYTNRRKNKNDNIIKELHELHLKIFERLINSLNNRTAVVPLSGGYDSRLIVDMFSRLKYDKVICFSYGRRNNWEVKTSRQVAENFGFKWIFIEYSRHKWYKHFNSREAEEYFDYAFNYSSVPNFHDWMAVMELRNKKLVPPDSVFIPGHGGDFLEGSHIPAAFMGEIKRTDEGILTDQIYNKHYSLWKPDEETIHIMKKRIKTAINGSNLFNTETASEKFENWDWKERQAKYIVNSIRTYEYFNYEWRLPLMDIELVNFWMSIPLVKRFNRKIYYHYTNTYQSNINIKANPARNLSQRIYDYFSDPWYGRINGNRAFLFVLFQKTVKVFPFIKEYVLNPGFIYSENKPGINTITALSRIRKKQGLMKVAE